MNQALPGIAAVVHDVPIWLALNVWVIFVTLYLSRLAYRALLARGWREDRARYFARKVIHIAGGGVVAFLLPFAFLEPYLPFISSMMLTGYLYWRRRDGVMSWFQDPSNAFEAHFTITWGASVLLGWLIGGSPWLGAIPALFMAWGDGVTGIVRNARHRRRVKSWDGSLAMLAVSLALGAELGYVGLGAAVVATLLERWGAVDDNVTVPLVSLAIFLTFSYVAPRLMRPLY